MAKFLSLDWFKEQITQVTHVVTERKVEKKVDEAIKELENIELKPYSNSFVINDNFIVILNNGQQLIKYKAEESLINQVKNANSEQEVVNLMSTQEIINQKQEELQQKKEIEAITNNFNILTEAGEFEIKENSVYLIGINRSIPKLLVNKFIEVVEKLSYYREIEVDEYLDFNSDDKEILTKLEVEYQALKRFWMKCCLNPNAQSAEDLYQFLEHHKFKIDKHGNFYCYRRVRSLENKNKELVDFVSNAYNKIKGVWKKSCKNYAVRKELDNNYTLMQISQNNNWKDIKHAFVGNLEELYLNLPNFQEKSYTSAHTGEEDYRVGTTISMPRNDGDDNNSVSCSKGFHQASKAYDYSGFGDQAILSIVNPMDVLAVPLNEVGKLRVCKWFFAMTLEDNEQFILDDEAFDVTELGDIFESQNLENLEEKVKESFTEEVKRHTFELPNISATEIHSICKSLEEIKTQLNSRVVTI